MAVVVSQTIQFKDLKKGMRARVLKVCQLSHCTQRLEEMGLTKGTEFSVIKVAPFGDPVEIDLRGYRLCLRKCEICGFELELLK